MKKVFHILQISRKDGKLSITMPSKDQFYKKIEHSFAFKKDFTTKNLKLIVENEKMYKTNPQLGYLHAEILYKCIIAYNCLGWQITTPEQAKQLLKEHCHYYTEIINTETGETLKEFKSFAKATIEEMSNIIDYAVVEVCGTGGVEVQSPEEYFRIKL